MAQTSSAAREPSMEEILASIRRIIEDSDVARHPSQEADGFPVRGEVAAFARPTSVQKSSELQSQEPPKAAISVEKPSMMRNVFADEPVLRGAISEQNVDSSAFETISDDEDEIILDAQNDDRRGAAEFSSAQTDNDAVEADHQVVMEAVDRSVEAGIAEAVDVILDPEAEGTTEAEPPLPHAPLGQPVVDSVEKEQETAHILSEVAERQVAASFQDLNHAVRAEPRRSFDDIAEELLRPMLQDWLDNNLPVLVERLVREEIERVVRGER
ncbi:DUF2497 domain-containing protein [Ochrobactrum sp. CM-21-5]|nr:PopZ family protein [Ochrobactrum sp. CM-21-5]MBC2886787.1 DUF2497 domain-containing protein [Ochrobactrum sp. CM-21-5]